VLATAFSPAEFTPTSSREPAELHVTQCVVTVSVEPGRPVVHRRVAAPAPEPVAEYGPASLGSLLPQVLALYGLSDESERAEAQVRELC
jgi:hypothetical protein